jgi:NDMA-dependent alcohol dehydrogenase
MKTRAAVLHKADTPWSVEEVELDQPGEGELLVEMVATGLCHSDDHQRRGDVTMNNLPMVGGHEGGGIVREIGPKVVGFEKGDHVLTTFIPSCGKCRFCARGMQNLCDLGAVIMDGLQLDRTSRMHTSDGRDISSSTMLGTFAEWQVYDQASLVRIDQDLPLEVACLVSCGVQTGFGSATAGDVQPGDVVIVAGVGGVGMNAVQGARACGAAHVIAIDPVEQKRKWAAEFGASEAFESFPEAMSRVHELTNWQGADVTILTASLVDNALIGSGYQSIRKAGTLVVTGVSADDETGNIPGFNAFDISMYQKRIQGALYGMKSPREAMPRLLGMYRAGTLKLDELITHVYTLDQINEAYADMHAGRNIRGVIHFGKK